MAENVASAAELSQLSSPSGSDHYHAQLIWAKGTVAAVLNSIYIHNSNVRPFSPVVSST